MQSADKNRETNNLFNAQDFSPGFYRVHEFQRYHFQSDQSPGHYSDHFQSDYQIHDEGALETYHQNNHQHEQLDFESDNLQNNQQDHLDYNDYIGRNYEQYEKSAFETDHQNNHQEQSDVESDNFQNNHQQEPSDKIMNMRKLH